MAAAKKKAELEQRTIVWIDESAFYLLPGVIRTYAPRGLTPVIKTPCSYSHLSVISAITPSGQLYFATQEGAYTSDDVVVFLKELRRKIGGKLLIIWDGAPIHRGQPIKDYLAKGAAKSIHLERLPGYAPELNPDEGIWQYLKRVELGNTVSQTLAELSLRLGEAIRRVRRKRFVVKGCVAQAGFTL